MSEKLCCLWNSGVIIVIYLKGYYDKFAGLGTAALAGWMIVALVLLGFVFYCATAKKKVK